MTIKRFIAFGILSAFLFFPQEGFASGVGKDFKTIKGRPKIKITADSSGPVRYDLDEEKQEEYALSIIQADGQILWGSRENKPVEHTVIGIYDNFVGANDASYIKILAENGRCDYMEHLNFHFNTVTYFGECEVTGGNE